MFFKNKRVNASAREQQTRHHSGGSSADNYNIRVHAMTSATVPG
jgi:hypothetical protein